jgi:type I restriction enzyme S subunit
VRWLYIDDGHIKSIAEEVAANYARTFLRGGEILVTVRGTLGGVAVVPERMAGFNISREVAMLPIVRHLNPQYVAFSIASVTSQNWLTEVTKGVAYTGVNIRDLKLLPVSIPPFDEQLEIVRRVTELFEFANRVDQRLAAGRMRTERITQSAMAKAFCGDLVETDAELARREGRDYETASMLLERINGERATACRQKGGRNEVTKRTGKVRRVTIR